MTQQGKAIGFAFRFTPMALIIIGSTPARHTNTHDLARWLARFSDSIDGLPPLSVLYCGRDMQFAAVSHTRGRFNGLFTLNESTLDAAIAAARDSNVIPLDRRLRRRHSS